MALRTGTQYVESLRDDREVWLSGEQIHDIYTHPAFRGCVRSIAELYDIQCDPKYRGILTLDSGSCQQTASLAYLVPRELRDLQRRRRMIELLAERTGGTLGRSPDYVPLILVALLAEKETLAQYDSQWSQNIEAFFCHCRDNDLFLSHSFADPQIDRSRSSDQVDHLRFRRTSGNGIVVNGVKSVATAAPMANEFLVLTPPRSRITPEQIVFFSVPIATPGLRFICRAPFSQQNRFDHPLSSRFDEMDAWAIFEDVQVPEDRIFLVESVDALQKVWRYLTSWAYYHLLIRMIAKAEVFVGVCTLISKNIGTMSFQNVREDIGDAVRYLETLRAFVRAAEADAVTTRSGIVRPNATFITVGHMYAIEHYSRLVQTVMRLGGQGILMAPSQADLDSTDILRYLADAPGGGGEEKIRLFKLGWDLSCSAFGARQLLFEMFNARDLTKNRLAFLQGYDTSRYEGIARVLAGIDDQEEDPRQTTPSASGG